MEPISAAMAEPMRPAIRMAIITGASSLAMADADHAADGAGQAALHQHRAGLQGDDRRR